MEELYTFTSTGDKLINHPDVVKLLKEQGRAKPISLQIAPTSRCQLKCSFCSNTNRDKQEDLEYSRITRFLQSMKDVDAKTVEWTGGGDPTLYHSINDLISIAHFLGFQQGMITNGLGFDRLKPSSLDSLKWLRISMNCLDYVNDIEIPILPINLTLGFSYVINGKTTIGTIDKLKKYVHRHGPDYVRVVPDCQIPVPEQKGTNIAYSKLVSEWGKPFFYQAKKFEKPEKCYWGYIKPFILHDGFVYRCSSVVLNDDAERSFHEKYRWCEMEDLLMNYMIKMDPFIPDSCEHCVFTKQNNLIKEIINPCEMWRFV